MTRARLLVEAVDAVDAIGGVDGEGDAVEAQIALDAREALRVVRFAGGAQNPVQDRLAAHAALFQTVLHSTGSKPRG